MPSFLKEGVPEMTREIEWYFNAWARLSKARDTAGSKTISAISMTQMESCMRMFNYAGGADVFVDVIQGIDKLYIEKAMKNS